MLIIFIIIKSPNVLTLNFTLNLWYDKAYGDLSLLRYSLYFIVNFLWYDTLRYILDMI